MNADLTDARGSERREKYEQTDSQRKSDPRKSVESALIRVLFPAIDQIY
jgi:hypothetical protein